MSSIRLFILGSLAARGPMHGYQLRVLAEEERITRWTDITVGAIYGAMNRLATEGLIEQVRVEHVGGYPARQVYEISEIGRQSLRTLRKQALAEITLAPDPVDLGLTRLDPDRLDELPAVLTARIAALRGELAANEASALAARPYLTEAERFVQTHRLHRLRGEIAWHDELLLALPTIIADESARQDG